MQSISSTAKVMNRAVAIHRTRSFSWSYCCRATLAVVSCPSVAQARQFGNMLHAFIDESYTAERYYMAALIVAEDDLPKLDTALANTMLYATTFGIDVNTEFHAHRLMVGRNGWEPVKKQVRAKISIYQRFVTELAQLPAVMIVRGVDVTALNARYRYPHPPHQVVLQHTLEQINSYARSRREMVKVLADEVPDQTGHAARMAWHQIVGTPGYLSSKLAAIVAPLEFSDSRSSAGLQATDAIAYIYRRLDAHTETDARVSAARHKTMGLA